MQGQKTARFFIFTKSIFSLLPDGITPLFFFAASLVVNRSVRWGDGHPLERLFSPSTCTRQAAWVGGVLARRERADKAAPCFAKAWTQASGGARRESGNVFVWGLVECVRVRGRAGFVRLPRIFMGVIPQCVGDRFMTA